MISTVSHHRTAAALVLLAITTIGHAAQTYSFQDRGTTYDYSVTQTGDNYTFEFARNPGVIEERLRVVMHVFDAVYQDASMSRRHSYFFMKEGAKCFVFDASLYTYQACILPNEYSPGNEQRFWGYVTRLPNGWWLVTRQLLPAVLVLGTALYFLFRGQRRDSSAG